MSGYEKGIALASGISPAQINPTSAAQINSALKELCRDPEARVRHVDLPKLFRANPVAYKQLCFAGIDVRLAARPDEYRFASAAERNHLRREQCRLILETMDGEHPGGNWPRMFALHPDFFVLACGASFHALLAQNATTRSRFSDRALHQIGRRSCSEALRRGVIDTSQSTGPLDFRANDRALQAIVRQEARDVGSA